MKKITDVTRTFGEGLSGLEKQLYIFSQNQAAMRELRAAEARYAATGEEADSPKEAQARYAQIFRNLNAVERAAGDTEAAISEGIHHAGLGKEIASAIVVSGMGNVMREAIHDGASTYFGGRLGDEAGTLAANTLSVAFNGALAGAMVSGPFAVMGLGLGAIFGAATGILQNYQKQDDAFKSYYKSLYKSVSASTTASLANGSALAAKREEEAAAMGLARAGETFSSLSSALSGLLQDADAAMDLGYNETRKAGLSGQIESYGGALGEELRAASKAIGAGRASLDNLADQYTEEALAAVLTGKETALNWSDENTERLKELAGLYQDAMANYRDGSARSGILVETYLEEARALAQAEYDSSEMVKLQMEAEEDMITAIRENTAALEGWKTLYSAQQNFTKGQASANKEKVMLSSKLNPNGDIWVKRAETEQSSSPLNDGRFYHSDGSFDVDYSYAAAYLPQYAYGLNYVPYNNFPALLHQGERVMTAAEARRPAASVTITGNSFTIREEADIGKVASALLERMELAGMRG